VCSHGIGLADRGHIRSHPCPGLSYYGGGLDKYGCHTNRKTEERLVYRDGEERAKACRVGLWKDAKPLPPWQYRRGKNREK
jgi:endonuclease YncB( thermonuclease family)